VRLNPVLESLATYPFVRLTEAAARARASGADVLDFGVGEPREETPAFIRRALTDAVEAEPVSTYPLSEGLPELREAIAAWCALRFGAALDPATEVVPTFGSKEAIFHLAQVVAARGDRVAVTTPGYPVPARGALFAGAEVLELALLPARGWLPDLDAVDWSGVALLWLNFPNNPTAATATPELFEQAAALARRHGFVVACDEAYSELWFAGDPPLSGLQLSDRTQVVVFNTLSKRSSMPGYRSGFVAGDPAVIAALKRYRPNVGVAPPTFIQRAAVAAWRDEDHVRETRARYGAKRDALLPALRAAGMTPAGGDASFFLWLAVDGDAEAFALALLRERGIVVAPGPYFGPGGEGHVRVALVPTLEACREAARRLGSTP
jgi:acetylornithine aminotransferase